MSRRGREREGGGGKSEVSSCLLSSNCIGNATEALGLGPWAFFFSLWVSLIFASPTSFSILRSVSDGSRAQMRAHMKVPLPEVPTATVVEDGRDF